MNNEELEKKIFEKFDETKDVDNIVGKKIDKSDFRLKEVLDFLGDSFDKKILDIGCGKGRFCRIIKDSGFNNIIGAEPSGEIFKMAKELNKDIDFVRASITNLPFEDGEFDFLLCVEVIEHVPDIEKAIKEMARVLKPKGKFIIIDKNILSLHSKYFVPTIFYKKYLEAANKWMYPNNFPFKEKYFIPRKLNNILKRHFSDSRFNFMPRKMFFPFFNLFVAWKGTK